MPVRKGTYVLFVTLDAGTEISPGALGLHFFDAGTYCYAGSAMGGLDQRLSRHLSRTKKLRWHIDYLTSVCGGCEAWESYPDPIPECTLARMAAECGGVPEMDGFGCSDCKCRTHLFRMDSRSIGKLLSRANLERFGTRTMSDNIIK